MANSINLKKEIMMVSTTKNKVLMEFADKDKLEYRIISWRGNYSVDMVILRLS